MMKQTISFYFFLFYILSIFVLGTVYVGPLSIRVISTIIMTFIIINASKHGFRNDYIKVYILFILLMLISQLLNGDYLEYKIFKKIVAYYFVSIISFFAVLKYVNSFKSLKLTLLLLMIIVFFNSLVSIMQFLNIPIGWFIGGLFEDLSNVNEYIYTHDEILGASIIPGIFGNVIANAFYLAIISPICIIFIENSKNLFSTILWSFIFISFLLAIYVTQQRTAFILVVTSFIVFGVKLLIKKQILILPFLIIMFCLSTTLLDLFQNIDWGRLVDFENSNRNRLYNIAFKFISDNWLFGGPIKFAKLAGYSAHNMILDSIIMGGIISAVVFWIFIIIIVKNIMSNILHAFKTSNNMLFYICISLIIGLISGLFHNTSFLLGETMLFVILALMIQAKKYYY